MEDQKKTVRNVLPIPSIVWSLVAILMASVLAYKVIITPFNLQFDFPSFLSLILALFSVALAALFYFKATQTSNMFYDNTYKFTHDIAELLARIESGFGEKLRHLDEAYTGMQDRFDRLPSRLPVQEAKRELKEEEKELEKIIKEKEKLIDNLLSKAALQDEEKEQFLEALNSREEALQQARQEISFLHRRLQRADVSHSRSVDQSSIEPNLLHYLGGSVLRMMEPEYVASHSFSQVVKRFQRIFQEIPEVAVTDMKKYNLLDDENNLTDKGYMLLRQLVTERL